MISIHISVRPPARGVFFYLNRNKTSRKMKPTPKQSQEINKNYEKVVEHLIKEGYADDKESANSIISGMSESWFNLIISE